MMEKRRRPAFRRPASRLIVIMVVVLFAGFYFMVDPTGHAWVPKCPTKMLTGIDYPGCGSQRMLHALLHGNLKSAWEANRFLMVCIPYILLLTTIELFPSRFPKLRRNVLGTKGLIAMLAAILAWTLVRNLYGW